MEVKEAQKKSFSIKKKKKAFPWGKTKKERPKKIVEFKEEMDSKQHSRHIK